MNRLSGKTALVTGAGQGIGRAVAQKFVSEGACVLALDNDPGRLQTAVLEIDEGHSAIEGFAADISQRGEVRAAVARCLERFGGLDILVANAGVGATAPFLEVDDASWQRVLGINLTGTFYCVQEAARVMAPRGKGAVVVVASTNAFWVEYHMTCYNTSKAGVIGLVRSAAIDLAPIGVRVNAVEPGVVNTPLAAFVVKNPAIGPEYLKKIPLGSFAEAEDVANAALFFACDDSAYITGQTLVLDGGMTLGLPESSGLLAGADH